jgi:hypothetical protein
MHNSESMTVKIIIWLETLIKVKKGLNYMYVDMHDSILAEK